MEAASTRNRAPETRTLIKVTIMAASSYLSPPLPTLLPTTTNTTTTSASTTKYHSIAQNRDDDEYRLGTLPVSWTGHGRKKQPCEPGNRVNLRYIAPRDHSIAGNVSDRRLKFS